MIDIPSGKYFVSHSYWDRVLLNGYTRPNKSTEVFDPKGKPVELKDAIDHTKDPISLLKKQFSNDVELFLFPAISVSPLEFVSNSLIEAILACVGMIYLEGGASAKSFWVAFERDYAIRAKKRMFAYDPANQTFISSSALPLNLQVFVSCTAYDRPAVKQILEHMRDQRYFNIADYETLRHQRLPSEKRLRTSIVEKLNKGGYLVTFWTAKAAKSGYTQLEIQFAYEYGQSLTLDPENPGNDRVLLALLDETPLPEWVQHKLSDQTIATIPVQLYGDKERSLINRVDDLVVRLYWLIFRNQFPELIYE